MSVVSSHFTDSSTKGDRGLGVPLWPALLIVFAVESIIGFIYTWGIGHDVVLFGIHMPALLAKSEPIRMSMGYLHSALGFYYLMLFCIWLAYGFYQKFRFHVGVKRLFPGASV